LEKIVLSQWLERRDGKAFGSSARQRANALGRSIAERLFA
jgi:hypothetical protein